MHRKYWIHRIPDWLRGNEQYIQIIENHLEAELRNALTLLPLAEKPADLSAERLTIRDGDEGIVLRDQDMFGYEALDAYAQETDAWVGSPSPNRLGNFFRDLAAQWRERKPHKYPD